MFLLRGVDERAGHARGCVFSEPGLRAHVRVNLHVYLQGSIMVLTRRQQQAGKKDGVPGSFFLLAVLPFLHLFRARRERWNQTKLPFASPALSQSGVHVLLLLACSRFAVRFPAAVATMACATETR